MFQRLTADHPGARVQWQPLGFPLADRSPIEAVDVAFLLEPPPRPEMSVKVLRREPRVVSMAANHPLAERKQLTVADVLGETFPRAHPSLDRHWVGFWTLDEERGGVAKATDDRIAYGEEGGEVVASGRAIATTSVSVADAFPHPGMVSVPLVDGLVAIARDFAGADGARN